MTKRTFANRFGAHCSDVSEPVRLYSFRRRAEFFSWSLDTGRHPAYDVLVNKFMGMITDPKQMETYFLSSTDR